MARTGRFGRLPRSSPSLSATIVAMLREAQSMRDSNISDAWKNGTDFEGHKVTDDEIIAYWKDRRDHVAKDDPLWDQYNATYQSYDFAVAESKMSLRYAQHSVNETQMSAFYTEWANKLPKDSEGYRTLMRSAAQFADAAKARAKAGAAAARDKSYVDGINAADAKWSTGFNAVWPILNEAAQRYGILSAKEDLGDLRATEGDNDRFLNLFDAIASDPTYAAYKAQLAAATGSDTFTYDSWLGLLDQNRTGIAAKRDLAKKFDKKSDLKNLEENLKSFDQWRRSSGDIDDRAAYEVARREWMSVWASDLSTAEAKVDATNTFLSVVDGLRKTSSDPVWLAQLDVEANALRGNASEVAGRDGAVESDQGLLGTAQSVSQHVVEAEAIRSGDAVYQPVVNDNRQIGWSVIPVESANPNYVVFVDTDGTGVRPVVVTPQDITVQPGVNPDPNTGVLSKKATLTPGLTPLLGKTVVINGRRYYGILKEGSGGEEMTWYDTLPVVPGVAVVQNPDGSITLQWNATGAANVNPYEAIRPDKDPTGAFLPDSTRYDNLQTAVTLSNPNASEALVQTDLKTIATTVAKLTRGDPDAFVQQMGILQAAKEEALRTKFFTTSEHARDAAERAGLPTWQVRTSTPGEDRASSGGTYISGTTGQPTTAPQGYATAEEALAVRSQRESDAAEAADLERQRQNRVRTMTAGVTMPYNYAGSSSTGNPWAIKTPTLTLPTPPPPITPTTAAGDRWFTEGTSRSGYPFATTPSGPAFNIGPTPTVAPTVAPPPPPTYTPTATVSYTPSASYTPPPTYNQQTTANVATRDRWWEVDEYFVQQSYSQQTTTNVATRDRWWE